jgi:hypothetical protein
MLKKISVEMMDGSSLLKVQFDMDLKPFSKEEAMSINQNVFGIFAEALEDLSKINGQWVYEDIVFNEYNFRGKEQTFAMMDLKFNCSFHS